MFELTTYLAERNKRTKNITSKTKKYFKPLCTYQYDLAQTNVMYNKKKRREDIREERERERERNLERDIRSKRIIERKRILRRGKLKSL